MSVAACKYILRSGPLLTGIWLVTQQNCLPLHQGISYARPRSVKLFILDLQVCLSQGSALTASRLSPALSELHSWSSWSLIRGVLRTIATASIDAIVCVFNFTQLINAFQQHVTRSYCYKHFRTSLKHLTTDINLLATSSRIPKSPPP